MWRPNTGWNAKAHKNQLLSHLLPHALVADEVGVDRVLRLELRLRDLPDVRPEERVPLRGRPDALVQLVKQQGVVGHLVQHRRLEGRFRTLGRVIIRR